MCINFLPHLLLQSEAAWPGVLKGTALDTPLLPHSGPVFCGEIPPAKSRTLITLLYMLRNLTAICGVLWMHMKCCFKLCWEPEQLEYGREIVSQWLGSLTGNEEPPQLHSNDGNRPLTLSSKVKHFTDVHKENWSGLLYPMELNRVRKLCFPIRNCFVRG